MALDADEISRYVHYLERMMKHLSKENTELKKELSKLKARKPTELWLSPPAKLQSAEERAEAFRAKANAVDWQLNAGQVRSLTTGRPYRG